MFRIVYGIPNHKSNTGWTCYATHDDLIWNQLLNIGTKTPSNKMVLGVWFIYIAVEFLFILEKEREKEDGIFI